MYTRLFFLLIHKIFVLESFLHYFKNLYKLVGTFFDSCIFIMLNIFTGGKTSFV